MYVNVANRNETTYSELFAFNIQITFNMDNKSPLASEQSFVPRASQYDIDGHHSIFPTQGLKTEGESETVWRDVK